MGRARRRRRGWRGGGAGGRLKLGRGASGRVSAVALGRGGEPSEGHSVPQVGAGLGVRIWGHSRLLSDGWGGESELSCKALCTARLSLVSPLEKSRPLGLVGFERWR